MSSGSKKTDWQKQVVKTNAKNHEGVKELCSAFLAHLDFMKKDSFFDNKLKTMENFYFNTLLKDLVQEKIENILKSLKESKEYLSVTDKLKSHKMDPFSAVKLLEDKLINNNIKYEKIKA